MIHIQKIPTEWADASKLVDHNAVKLVCRVVGSDGRGMFTGFCCFKAVNRDAGGKAASKVAVLGCVMVAVRTSKW